MGAVRSVYISGTGITPEVVMASELKLHLDIDISPDKLRAYFKSDRWHTISMLAHAIHDEKP